MKGLGFEIPDSHYRHLSCSDRKIPDKKIQRTILNRIKNLSDEPDKQGKRLVKDLSALYPSFATCYCSLTNTALTPLDILDLMI